MYYGSLTHPHPQRRPFLGIQSIKLHHDNVKPHIHKDVVSYLQSEGVTIMPHPPSSPDLAPGDFWFFDLIKQNIGDQMYEVIEKRRV